LYDGRPDSVGDTVGVNDGRNNASNVEDEVSVASASSAITTVVIVIGGVTASNRSRRYNVMATNFDSSNSCTRTRTCTDQHDDDDDDDDDDDGNICNYNSTSFTLWQIQSATRSESTKFFALWLQFKSR
tara:strand:- start:20 stop:406 length:387 start_codon:yes stop_codon:yes gene_type:complete